MHKPVTILTGFLGAGKTTFLNHLLEENRDVRYAIIENEFGEQGIDNELVIRPYETIVELNNGCLCCTLNDNLYDILNELFERREQFDEIIIEATGVADPTGLAEPFIAHPVIKKHFPLTSVICLVDAEQVHTQLAETEEALNQIVFSDILLLNKTDLVNDQRIREVEAKLRQLNPLARIIRGAIGHYPTINYREGNQEKLTELLDRGHHHHDQGTEDKTFPVQRPHHHHHHDHTEEMHSISFTFDRPFDHAKLTQQLFVYLNLQAKGLYRIKGLLWLAGHRERFLLQSVGKRFDIKEHGVWAEGVPKRSVLVFIGKNLPAKGLENMLKKGLATGEYREY
ncbi:GTP-binding protein [Lewinella sp. W8]|uniref:CobW family GTP-binding protein n=1 Tax=Lewinella sp. W8 TaxID=2528208 RepID=UPI001067D9A4|nr:GTP-binding protein [Lewinella sp. W8]MTB51119.1 GTP-binding protein [Lewinella sp. W8]